MLCQAIFSFILSISNIMPQNNLCEIMGRVGFWQLDKKWLVTPWEHTLQQFQHCLTATAITTHTHTHTHTRLKGPMSGTTRVSRYQKGKTNLDFTGARDSEWQWQQLGHMQVCTLLQTDNHASTPPLSFLQAGCPSCRPTNSVKALKAKLL